MQNSGSSPHLSGAALVNLVQLLLAGLAAQQKRAMADVRKGADRAFKFAVFGACISLTLLLQSNSEAVQQHAICALENLAIYHADSGQAKIATDSELRNGCTGAVLTLAQLLRRDAAATEMRVLAANTLRDLAGMGTSSIRAKIAAAGAIPPLVQLLSSPSAGAPEAAARTLAELAVDSKVGLEIAAAGAIPPLVKLLWARSAGAQEHAAWALDQLASGARSSASAIKAAGAIPLLDNLQGAASSSMAIREATRHALQTLKKGTPSAWPLPLAVLALAILATFVLAPADLVLSSVTLAMPLMLLTAMSRTAFARSAWRRLCQYIRRLATTTAGRRQQTVSVSSATEAAGSVDRPGGPDAQGTNRIAGVEEAATSSSIGAFKAAKGSLSVKTKKKANRGAATPPDVSRQPSASAVPSPSPNSEPSALAQQPGASSRHPARQIAAAPLRWAWCLLFPPMAAAMASAAASTAPGDGNNAPLLITTAMHAAALCGTNDGDTPASNNGFHAAFTGGGLPAAAAGSIELSSDEDGLCSVCMAEPLSILLAPCGHLELCRRCYEGIKLAENLVRPLGGATGGNRSSLWVGPWPLGQPGRPLGGTLGYRGGDWCALQLANGDQW